MNIDLAQMLEPPTSDEVYCCKFCSYQAERPFQVQHHVKKTHKNADVILDVTLPPERLFCISCDFMSYRKLTLYEHSKQKHGRKPVAGEQFVYWYKCKRCKLKMHSGLSLVNHLDTCVISRPKKRRKNRSKPAAKPSAKKPRVDYKKMLQERNEFVLSRPYKCPECSYATGVKSNLNRHVSRQHASDADIQWHQCEKCPYVTKYKHGLQSHVLQRHAAADEITWHQCEECHYRTKAKFNLKKHMLKHASSEQIDWHQCEQCPYKAKRKMYLTQHMLTHASADQIRWFECEQCEYKAKTKDHVKRHVRRKHTGEDDLNERVRVQNQQLELLENYWRSIAESAAEELGEHAAEENGEGAAEGTSTEATAS